MHKAKTSFVVLFAYLNQRYPMKQIVVIYIAMFVYEMLLLNLVLATTDASCVEQESLQVIGTPGIRMQNKVRPEWTPIITSIVN